MTPKKTLQDLIESSKEFFVAEDVAGVLGCDAHTLRLTARQRPELLQFPCICMGNRVKIPRIPFLRTMGIEVSA
jgi:hypothetical protein